MKLSSILFVAIAFVGLHYASAEEPKTIPPLTVQQEVELFDAIASLDQGCVKVIGDKPQFVPFVFPSSVRWILAQDSNLVKPAAEAYKKVLAAKQAELNPKNERDNPSIEAALQKAMGEIYFKDDRNSPSLQKIALADLNLEANPIPFQTLTKLKPIIQQ